ncbi:hypothetical protein [Aminobacterium colombiense]
MAHRELKCPTCYVWNSEIQRCGLGVWLPEMGGCDKWKPAPEDTDHERQINLF